MIVRTKRLVIVVGLIGVIAIASAAPVHALLNGGLAVGRELVHVADQALAPVTSGLVRGTELIDVRAADPAQASAVLAIAAAALEALFLPGATISAIRMIGVRLAGHGREANKADE